MWTLCFRVTPNLSLSFPMFFVSFLVFFDTSVKLCCLRPFWNKTTKCGYCEQQVRRRENHNRVVPAAVRRFGAGVPIVDSGVFSVSWSGIRQAVCRPAAQTSACLARVAGKASRARRCANDDDNDGTKGSSGHRWVTNIVQNYF